MRFRGWSVRRSLLIASLSLVISLFPSVVRAIAPNSGLFAQIPGLLDVIDWVQPPIWNGGLDPETYLPGSNVSHLPQPINVLTASTSPKFVPRQQIVAVNFTNYEPRMERDLYGNLLTNELIAVLHETVGSASSAINTFQNNHPNDDDQASYHALIARDGTVIYLVPPEMRAFGAGNSVFDGPNGSETVRLDPILPPSVNNFAYHASLESPSDGRGNGATHSGYTSAQYQSLAWLIAQTNIPDDRITTHQAVDRSGNRRDPRSFDFARFFDLLHHFREP